MYKKLILVTVCFLIIVSISVHAQQLAFPGAEGGGRFAVGGRGGSVYEVTNLNDSGAGSLRDGISEANRTIIFRVSGIIHLNSKLIFAKDNITVAGQTAPGDGICITGYTVNIKASNIIIRHIRCRLSDVNDIEDDSMNSFSGNYQNIIIDHCSLGWSVDETGTFYDIKNFTLQWCLLAESLYHSVHDKGDHGYAGIWGGQNASFHHNLLAHHTSRNPRFCGSRYTGRPDLEVVDFRNNVLYNWGNVNSVYGGEGGNYNMINNYYKAGPATPGNLSTSSSSNKRNRILNYTSYYYASDAAVYPDTLFGGKFYIDGNYVYGYPDVTADNWTKGVQKDSYSKAAALIAAAKQNTPFTVAPVSTQSAEEAYVSVLQGVGATLPKRDAIDTRIIHETTTGTATYEGSAYAAITATGITHPSGIIDTQTDVGGLPVYNSTTAPVDTDHDGMPDAWELAQGLNQNDNTDGNSVGADGYTNLEKYLNSLTDATPTITTENTLVSFNQSLGTPSSTQSIIIYGVNLTDDIHITPPVGFEVSADGGTTWKNNASSLVLLRNDGIVPETTIQVRLNSNVIGFISGNISCVSNNAAQINILVMGNTSSVVASPVGTASVVAKDGTGNYATVQAAIDAAPTTSTSPYIIFIKNGIYKEKITIPSNKPFIQLVGESVANTILTFDDYSGKAMPGGGTFGTSNSASVTVNASDFSAINITFENTTGDAPQALAINVNGDRAAFKNCRFLGGQDTVLANGTGNKQYFRNCYIDGVVDFIFGNARAVFDSCVIYAKSRVDGLTGSYITAANTQSDQQYGYVFRNCILPSNTGVTQYVLGRPWQNSTGSNPLSYPRVVFLNTTMGNKQIKPEGWAIWDAGTVTSSIFDAEYKSRKFNGDLVNISQRVNWSFQLTDEEAATYSNTTLFGTWDPCLASTDFCNVEPSPVVVSNFKANKGQTQTIITWNISWLLKNVTYQLFRSSDNISFAKINEQTSVTDTTVNFSYTENIPPAGKKYYYFLVASQAGKSSHVTSTIEVSSIPTITLTGSLSDFLQGLGTPSGVQGYKVSGQNLLDDLVITPPTGFEISADGSNWYTQSSPLVLEQSNNSIASTSISVRLNAFSVGEYDGDIAHTSQSAVTQNIYVSGETQSDALPVSTVLLYWPMSSSNLDDATTRSVGVEAGSSSFNKLVSSNGLIVANVPAYSTTFGQAFGATANGEWTVALGGPGGNLNRRVYEQFVITATSDYSVRVDSILLKASFYNTSSNTKLAVVYSKSGFTNADSTNVSGGVGADGTPLVSTANGGFTTPIVLANETSGTTRNYRLALAGNAGVQLEAGEALTIRLYFSCGSSSQGRYGKVKDVYIKGLAAEKVNPPVITVTGALTDFSQTLDQPSATQSLNVVGSYLTENILVTPPVNFEVSGDAGVTWKSSADPLSLTGSENEITKDILVRLNATTVGEHQGTLSLETAGTSAINIPVMGNTLDHVTGLPARLASHFTLSPNPVETTLTIHFSDNVAEGLLSVFTMTGAKVIELNIINSSHEAYLDVSKLAPGMYFANFTSQHESGVLKFIRH